LGVFRPFFKSSWFGSGYEYFAGARCAMKVYRYIAVLSCLFVVPLLLSSFMAGKDTKKKIKGDVCSASNPASICTEANVCGSASSPCSIDIRRSQGTSATATPDFSGAKSNKAFCIKVGTTVTFMSGSKNTGFVIDFGDSNPFDHEGAIIGGADRPITVTAKHPGCYTYSVGACTAGTVYGMCGNADTQLIISAN
jgi:plastocyanin